MAQRPKILRSAQAQFPASASKTVNVRNAWRREDSTLDYPDTTGMDGWTRIGEPATAEVVARLRAEGFTWVNLESGGVANPFKDVPIADLL